MHQTSASNNIAVIDMGTNTFHLLIVKPAAPRPMVLHKEKVSVKIGQGGISHSVIVPEAIDRAMETLHYFKQRTAELGIGNDHILATATSAVRSAQNGQQFVEQIYQETGIRVKVISGAEEAEYIYYGVKASLEIGPLTSLIIDIGGGSVEFILCNQHKIFWKKSFEIGAQRLLDKFMHTDPIDPAAVVRLDSYFDEQLIDLANAVHQYQPEVLIGSSGSFDTLAEIYYLENDLPIDWENQTEFTLPFDAFYTIHEQLLTKNHAGRMAIPGMIEMRVDMIVVASCLVDYVLSRFHIKKIRVSTGALKEGILFKLLT
jgi:exopolyphosphatase/guanosine-5'-triphosphate,3'-diphosphate pyrophosphatase